MQQGLESEVVPNHTVHKVILSDTQHKKKLKVIEGNKSIPSA